MGFKVHIYENEKITKTISFRGDDDNTENKTTEQMLHLDDSIRVVKNKIIKELENKVSYKELYLFTKKRQFIDPIVAIETLKNIELDESTVKQILDRLQIDSSEFHLPPDHKYSYDDIKEFIYKYGGKPTEIEIEIPIGQKFEKAQPIFFEANPYKQMTMIEIPPLFNFENSLLMNYFNEESTKEIYICLAKDVYEYHKKYENLSKIVEIFFPFLYKDKILTLDLLNEKSIELLEISNEKLGENIWKLYENVDFFYDIYRERKTELPYTENGIKSFFVNIESNLINILHLDTIFKNIHATKNIPFIKYNPGFRRENIYRLYSEKISTNGKKIPFLSQNEILRLSKETGKTGQISMYIRHENIQFYIHFNKDGKITVHAMLNTPISPKEINEVLQKYIYPEFEKLNILLYDTGYKMDFGLDPMRERRRRGLSGDDVVGLVPNTSDPDAGGQSPTKTHIFDTKNVDRIDYGLSIQIQKKMDLEKYRNCISSLFDIESVNIVEGAKMRFKRVENYEEMNQVALLINNEYNRTRDIEDVIRTLMRDPTLKMSEEQARDQVIKFFGEHTLIQGELLENSGFPVTIKLDSTTNILDIRVENINQPEYISILKTYFDSILRIFQFPETSSPIEKITKICTNSLDYKNIDKTTIENLVAPEPEQIKTIIQPILFEAQDDDFFLSSPIEEIGENNYEDYELDEQEETNESIAEPTQEVLEKPSPEASVEPSPEVLEKPSQEVLEKPSPEASAEPIQEVLEKPSPEASVEPSPEVLEKPSPEASAEPTQEASAEPIQEVLEKPSPEASAEPIQEVLEKPSPEASAEPIQEVLEKPSPEASAEPTQEASAEPTQEASAEPIQEVLEKPIQEVLEKPSPEASAEPTQEASAEPSPKVLEKPSKNHKKTDSDDEFFGMDVEGGATEDLEKKIEGKNLKNPNPFQEKIEKYDPALILKQDQGKYSPYSRVCPPAVMRQPVLLTEEEKTNIDNNHPNSYSTAIQYGSDPNKQNWYICPRYWSFKTNSSLSDEEVAEILKTNPNAIIPAKSRVIPKGSFIYEFNAQKEHQDEKGNYLTHYPGFIKGKHPDGYNLPCCFKREQNIENPLKEPIDKQSNYVIASNSYPLPRFRWGFLPPQIQVFFKIDYKQHVDKTNNAIIKKNTECLLRYGVEQIENQSFLGVFADIYASFHNLNVTPKIKDFRQILINAVNLDMFVKYHNGSLVRIFIPKKSIEVDHEKYKDSWFAKLMQNTTNTREQELFTETIAAYENFLEYLKDESTYIDHTYLWDIITQPNENLIPIGLNLVILEISKNDVVEILCPTSSYSARIYDSNRETLILLKQDDYYEPIYLFSNISKTKITRTFSKKNTQIASILKFIEKSIKFNCKPHNSLPNIYDFKRPISAQKTAEVLHEIKYQIYAQVVNFQTKTVGFIVSKTTDALDSDKFFVPCSPSTLMDDYDFVFLNDIDIWKNYSIITQFLTELRTKTDGRIKCSPKIKIIENNMIIGLLTETNQYIRISPASENIKDNLESLEGVDYIEVDNAIFSNISPEKKRIQIIQNIRAEGKYYRTFRNTIRELLSQYETRLYKMQILDLLDNPTYTYNQKLEKMIEIIKKIAENSIIFDDTIGTYGSSPMETHKASPSYNKKFGLSQIFDSKTTLGNAPHHEGEGHNDNCERFFPQKNLIMDIENETLYYSRIADELIRFQRIRKYLLEPMYFLNLTNINYKINEDEVVLLESVLRSEDLSDLRIFNFNDYIHNISYEIAEPDKTSEKYSNIVAFE